MRRPFRSMLPPSPLRFDDSERGTPPGIVGSDLKHINLSPTVEASFGGEVRQRFEHFNNELFGLGTVTHEGYDLSRVLLFADLRIISGPRIFIEIGEHSAIGKRGTLQEADRDDLDLHQAFLDIPVSATIIRIGRQEMPLGSTRFVDYREGPNVRQTFDGIRVHAPLGTATLDLFGVAPTLDRPHVFDDKPAFDQTFAGAYFSVPVSGPRPGPWFELGPKPILALDSYYYWHRIGPDAGYESRHSAGLRGWGENKGWDYDVEGILQFGHSTAGEIRAGGISSKTGYTFSAKRWSPRIGTHVEWFSGDKSATDREVNTVDPLFPRGAYFSEPGLQTFSNIIDIGPSLTVNPTRKLAVQTGVDLVWRATRDDFVYIAPLTPVPGTAGIGGLYVGTSAMLQAT